MKPRAASARIDLPPLSLRADVRPGSVDAEARTVEVIFSTGAPVMRYDWSGDTRYVETLSLKASDVRLERLNSGAPFLNTHSAYDLADILGVVVEQSAKVAGGKGIATIRFSKRDAVEPVWQDIRDGIIRNVSVGYRVHTYEQTEASEGKPAVRHATDWEPFEISAVPMPADNGAKVRAEPAQTNPCVVITRAAKETPPMDEILCRNQHANPADAKFCAECGETLTRADEGTAGSSLLDPKIPQPLPEPHRAAEPTETEAAVAGETERISGILRACEAARLPMSRAQHYIKSKTPLLTVQTEVLDSLRARGNDLAGPKDGPPAVQFVGADPLENVWRGIGEALMHKAAPQFFPKLSDLARPYRTRSLLSAAELCLHHRGVRTHDLDKLALAGAAFGLTQRGVAYTSSSDFANILADASNKILRAAYEAAPQTWGPLARRIPIADFKTVNVTQLGDAPALLEVKEHGEFTRGTVADAKETFSLATYGRMFTITRKALINDDLDAFSRMPVNMARQARNLESDLIWAQITANGLMADGVALFSTAATRVNLASAAAAIDIGPLGIGQAAMRIQKGLDGATLLNLQPRYLIVPTTKEVLALQYTTLITPVIGAGVNPFSGRLQVIVEPRLDANSTTAWYLSASTDQTDIIVYGFLDGADGPMVESRVGFDVDGLEIKCRHDVAAKVVDFRGLFKNAGV